MTNSDSVDLTVFRALGAAAEAAEQRGQDPAGIHEQIGRLADERAVQDCNTSVCGGFIAFGPPAGDVSGLGYCHECVSSSQTEWTAEAASVAAEELARGAGA